MSNYKPNQNLSAVSISSNIPTINVSATGIFSLDTVLSAVTPWLAEKEFKDIISSRYPNIVVMHSEDVMDKKDEIRKFIENNAYKTVHITDLDFKVIFIFEDETVAMAFKLQFEGE